MRRIHIATMLIMVLLLGACSVRQLTDEQRATKTDKEECAANAASLNDPPHNSNNPLWRAYFERCMRERGYTSEQLHKAWY